MEYAVAYAGAERPGTPPLTPARLPARGIGHPTPVVAEHLTLEDGAEVLLRPLEPDDAPLLTGVHAQLSAESRYKRFLGAKPRLSPKEVAFLTQVDHVDHEAIGAIAVETGDGVGVARYVRLRDDPEVAEVAVVVVDAWQRRGVGRALLESLCKRARTNGIERFTATLLTSNRATLHLLHDLGAMVIDSGGGSTLEIEVEIAADRPEARREALRQAAAGVVAAWLDTGATALSGGLARRPRRPRGRAA